MRLPAFLALLVLATSACVDAGVDDDTDVTAEALGAGCGTDGVACPSAPQGYISFLRLSFNASNNRLEALVSTQDGISDFYNIRYGIVGENQEYQVQIGSDGYFYQLGPVKGAIYYVSAQSCVSAVGPSYCEYWSSKMYLYVPGPGTHWVDPTLTPDVTTGNFWAAGGEPWGSGYRNLGVCMVDYKGFQVGKWTGGSCNFGYGGSELVMPADMVLKWIEPSIAWQWTYGGGVPSGAVPGGRENSRAQYICRAYHNGYQPGKFLGDGCHYGYGGKELVETTYSQVLTYPYGS